KHVRARLRDEFGFPKSEVHAQAYWSAGRAMGTRRGDEAATTYGGTEAAEDIAAQVDSPQGQPEAAPAPA
ncbi:hypothetical protein, partial [Mycobacterium avium]